MLDMDFSQDFGLHFGAPITSIYESIVCAWTHRCIVFTFWEHKIRTHKLYITRIYEHACIVHMCTYACV